MTAWNKENIDGKKFNRWTAIERDKNNSVKYMCECDCGVTKSVYKKFLKSGRSKSCGCYRSDNPSRKTHGMTGTRQYTTWYNMKNRCYFDKCDSYHLYGGRGIKVCDRWKNSFENFWEDMGDSYRDDLTIDRINADGDYEPKNCRWATAKEQSKNKRNSIYLTYNGVAKSLLEWADYLKMNTSTISSRYYSYKWDIKKIIETPVNYHKYKKR